MMQFEDTVNVPQPKAADEVNPEIQPKQKLKPVPAQPTQPAGVTQLGQGSQITSTAANVPTTLPQTGKGSMPGVELAPQVLTSSAGDGFGATSLPAPVPTTAAPATQPVTAPQPTLSPAPASGGALGPQLTPTDPNNPLTAQTITPGAGLDRVALAKQQFDTFTKSTDPAYQAALRDANRYGAATGRLGSGSLRTDFGNLANQRNIQLDTQRERLAQDALTGTVEDAWRGIGLAERQQGFQNTQQQQAFANRLAELGFDESALDGAFGRALQTWMAGQSGGTGSNTALAGANAAGNQGEDALSALEALLRARAASGGTTPTAAAPSGLPAGVDPAKIFPWM